MEAVVLLHKCIKAGFVFLMNVIVPIIIEKGKVRMNEKIKYISKNKVKYMSTQAK